MNKWIKGCLVYRLLGIWGEKAKFSCSEVFSG
jgi:hypothetical protein